MTNSGAEALQRFTFMAKQNDNDPADVGTVLRSAMGSLSAADADELATGFAACLRRMTSGAITTLKAAVDAENATR